MLDFINYVSVYQQKEYVKNANIRIILKSVLFCLKGYILKELSKIGDMLRS